MPRHVEGKLTPKQNKFIKEWIKTGDGTNSAIKAGYSKKTARFIASENLTKPYIKSKIEKVMSKEAEELGLNAEYVLLKLKKFAESDSEKIAPTVLKSIELIGRHLKMFHEHEKIIDMRLSEHKMMIEELGKDD